MRNSDPLLPLYVLIIRAALSRLPDLLCPPGHPICLTLRVDVSRSTQRMAPRVGDSNVLGSLSDLLGQFIRSPALGSGTSLLVFVLDLKASPGAVSISKEIESWLSILQWYLHHLHAVAAVDDSRTSLAMQEMLHDGSVGHRCMVVGGGRNVKEGSVRSHWFLQSFGLHHRIRQLLLSSGHSRIRWKGSEDLRALAPVMS
mmetsp:Transcript_11933/g.18708  ORF Transcript_11933/g.18708 Transcript_11933/m.18708 type:complete len:200 (-) Transcript_11933:105-704(-)